jgi:hypothetical protein
MTSPAVAPAAFRKPRIYPPACSPNMLDTVAESRIFSKAKKDINKNT